MAPRLGSEEFNQMILSIKTEPGSTYYFEGKRYKINPEHYKDIRSAFMNYVILQESYRSHRRPKDSEFVKPISYFEPSSEKELVLRSKGMSRPGNQNEHIVAELSQKPTGDQDSEIIFEIKNVGHMFFNPDGLYLIGERNGEEIIEDPVGSIAIAMEKPAEETG